MKKIYITGSTAGLFPHEMKLKFKYGVDILKSDILEIKTVSQLVIGSLDLKKTLDKRLKAVADADCVIFTNDWKDSIESRTEFKEAERLGKMIRMDRLSDYQDILRTLGGTKWEKFMVSF